MSDKVTRLYPTGLAADFDLQLAVLGFGVNPGGLRRRFWRDALRLNTLSDAELAALGLSRADIPGEVLRHRFPSVAPEGLRASL